MTKNVPQKDQRLHVALSDEDRRKLEEIAQYNSQSLAGLLRMLMLREHREVFGREDRPK